jgi:hypothetical protein
MMSHTGLGLGGCDDVLFCRSLRTDAQRRIIHQLDGPTNERLNERHHINGSIVLIQTAFLPTGEC